VQVVSVIDLMSGQVVRGKAGQRAEYRPIQSLLAADARPASVAMGLAAAGFRATYVADLDAIGGARPAWSIYETLMRSGLELWVDAGLSTAAQAREIANFNVDSRPLSAIVAGLESLRGPEELAAMNRMTDFQSRPEERTTPGPSGMGQLDGSANRHSGFARGCAPHTSA
jgi:uncharacterized protein related to proFAR isomerase